MYICNVVIKPQQTNIINQLNFTTMKANQNKAQSAKANESNVTNNVQANAQVEQPQATATATDAAQPQIKNTEKYLKANTKPTDVKRDVNGFKDGGTQIATATANKFANLGKFIAKFQAIEAKDGGKTVYIFATAEKVFVGYTSSELADVFGLPKREYKKGESESATDSPYLAELKQLQKAIEKVTTDDGKNFVLSFSEQLKAKIEQVTASEKEKEQFNKTFAAVIPLFDIITEAKFAEKHGEENLKIALALGYKFSDTKSDKESESK